MHWLERDTRSQLIEDSRIEPQIRRPKSRKPQVVSKAGPALKIVLATLAAAAKLKAAKQQEVSQSPAPPLPEQSPNLLGAGSEENASGLSSGRQVYPDREVSPSGGGDTLRDRVASPGHDDFNMDDDEPDHYQRFDTSPPPYNKLTSPPAPLLGLERVPDGTRVHWQHRVGHHKSDNELYVSQPQYRNCWWYYDNELSVPKIRKRNRSQIARIMETDAGEELTSADRCTACQRTDSICCRYTKHAVNHIPNAGSACARCRKEGTRLGCSFTVCSSCVYSTIPNAAKNT